MIHPVTKGPKLEKKFDTIEEAKIKVTKTEDWKRAPSKDFNISPKIESPKTVQKFHPTEVLKTLEESKVFPCKDIDKTLQIECSKIEEKYLWPAEVSKTEEDSKVFDQMLKNADSKDFFNQAVTERYVCTLSSTSYYLTIVKQIVQESIHE